MAVSNCYNLNTEKRYTVGSFYAYKGGIDPDSDST